MAHGTNRLNTTALNLFVQRKRALGTKVLGFDVGGGSDSDTPRLQVATLREDAGCTCLPGLDSIIKHDVDYSLLNKYYHSKRAVFYPIYTYRIRDLRFALINLVSKRL